MFDEAREEKDIEETPENQEQERWLYSNVALAIFGPLLVLLKAHPLFEGCKCNYISFSVFLYTSVKGSLFGFRAFFEDAIATRERPQRSTKSVQKKYWLFQHSLLRNMGETLLS